MSTTIETKVVRGIEFRDDPAREPCFRIVHLHHDVPDSGNVTVEARQQRAHRDYNQEVQTLEIAALCLSDFPNAPWELRMELARQCWDEARHAELFLRRLEELGGWKGMYPIANLDWAVVAQIKSLVARLAVQHRTFEAGSLDIEAEAVPMLRDMGLDEVADVVDAIEADEIQHVRFANEWLKKLTDSQPRAVLDVAKAMAWLRDVVAATSDDPLKVISTNGQMRQMAGFSEAEVAEVTRMEPMSRDPAAAAPDSSHE
jgi:uncharacterized ferritin-like protein (DUF455 family)